MLFHKVGGYCIASEWDRAYRLSDGAVPYEPKAKHNVKAYRRAVLSKLPHKSEHERDALFRAMQQWAREHEGGVAAFVAHESKGREAAEHERAYRKRNGLVDGPVFPMRSQREIDAGITMPPEEGD